MMREKNIKITQNIKILDQNTKYMQEHYECQDEHQEHFEDHDEHQEHIFEKIFDAKKTWKTPNLEIFDAWTLTNKKCI